MVVAVSTAVIFLNSWMARQSLYSFINSFILCFMDLNTGMPSHSSVFYFMHLFFQSDGRTYSYVAGLSSPQQSIEWNVLLYFAKIIPRICHNVNRVVFVFGDAVEYPIQVWYIRILEDLNLMKSLLNHNWIPLCWRILCSSKSSCYLQCSVYYGVTWAVGGTIAPSRNFLSWHEVNGICVMALFCL